MGEIAVPSDRCWGAQTQRSLKFFQAGAGWDTMPRIGSYIMWVAIAATCVTSSMFKTGLAANVLAIEIVKKTVNIEFKWISWFFAFIPAGLILLAIFGLIYFGIYLVIIVPWVMLR